MPSPFSKSPALQTQADALFVAPSASVVRSVGQSRHFALSISALKVASAHGWQLW